MQITGWKLLQDNGVKSKVLLDALAKQAQVLFSYNENIRACLSSLKGKKPLLNQ